VKIFKLSVVGDFVYQMYVYVDEEFSNNIMQAEKETWSVASYRFKDNKIVESYDVLGSGWKIDNNTIGIKLNNPQIIRKEVDLLTNSNSLMRKALIFVSKTSPTVKKSYLNESKEVFDRDFVPEIKKGGLVAWPGEHGFHPLTITCTCKGFFGGESGCTHPTCNVVLGNCQDNSNCKRTDSTSSCNCTRD